ncbi:trypsin-like peptidase domain-containing protein [Candidatus Latescibacterota bacterium]
MTKRNPQSPTNDFFAIMKLTVVVILLFTFTGGAVYGQLPVVRNGDSFESPFAAIYEKVSPAVVRIDVKSEVSQQRSQNPWPFFNNENQQQRQRPVEGMGSGVIIDREGHILTNNHVISGADQITVKINENESYDAEVIGTDPESDLAVIKLKLDGERLPGNYIAELGDSDTLQPGDYAIAIGNPIGLDRSISVGVISALGRHGFSVAGGRGPSFQNFIQTDAQINPGNSGGALVDINGKVIGINDMYTAQFAGIGFAIPVNLAKNVMTQLIASGEVKRGFVGIGPEVITDDIQEAMELPTKEGVLIGSVLENSPAKAAGIEHGDLIISLNGKKIRDFNDFLLRIGNHSPGDTVDLEVLHKKETKKVTLTLTDRTSFIATNANNSESWRGIHVTDINEATTEKYNLGGIDSGVVVLSIDENGPAAKVNLKEGDVIVEIEQTKISDIQDFARLKAKPELAKKAILIFKKRVSSNGQIQQGFVAVKNK